MVFSVVEARGAALQCRLLTAAASLVLSLGLWGIWGILASVAVAPGPQELGRMGLAAPRPVGSSWIRGLSTLEPPGKSKMGEMFKQSRKGRKTYFKCLLGSGPCKHFANNSVHSQRDLVWSVQFVSLVYR